jgi:EpsI family protein
MSRLCNNLVRNRRVWIVTILALSQAILLSSVKWDESSVEIIPLREFPRELQGWRTSQEAQLDREILDQLRPDDYLARTYDSADGAQSVDLFVGYFKSQRLGARPHSPQRCLPGSGWTPVSHRQISIPSYGASPAFVANEYLLERGAERIRVCYWYQNAERAVAKEVWLKAYVLPDLVRFRRSDVALVRVIQPARDQPASESSFSSLIYSALSTHFAPPPFPLP